MDRLDDARCDPAHRGDDDAQVDDRLVALIVELPPEQLATLDGAFA